MSELPKPAFEELGPKEITSLGYNVLRLARGNDLVTESGCHYLGVVYHGQINGELLDAARPPLEAAIAKRYLSARHVDTNNSSDDEKRLEVHQVVNGFVSRLFTEATKPNASLDTSIIANGLLAGDISWLSKHGRRKYQSQVIKYGLLGHPLKPEDYSRMFKVAASQVFEWKKAQLEDEDTPYVFERFAGNVVVAHLAANRHDKKHFKKVAPQLMPKHRLFIFPAK